jgi:glycosyltransferase involved in cell wall biosynthesis
MMPSLSAILIAKNEERDLPGCLEALKGLADEIVVVVTDDTTDKTTEIAKARGARTFVRAFDDYARMRQSSLDAAGSDWCLWIDPDERVTSELAAEIRRTLAENPQAAAFDIPFSIRFLGRDMSWGGLGHESHIRLFRRDKARFTGGVLHESLEVDGPVAELSSKIVHEPYRDIPDYLSKLDRYTTLAAQKRFESGKRFSVFHHLILPWEFFARVVLKGAFLDGYQGLVWAGLSSFHSWLKYVKLGRMQKEQSQ